MKELMFGDKVDALIRKMKYEEDHEVSIDR